jgi:hypothetical protein
MRVDLHPADRIGRGGRNMLVVAMTMVMVLTMVVFVWCCHSGTMSSAGFCSNIQSWTFPQGEGQWRYRFCDPR